MCTWLALLSLYFMVCLALFLNVLHYNVSLSYVMLVALAGFCDFALQHFIVLHGDCDLSRFLQFHTKHFIVLHDACDLSRLLRFLFPQHFAACACDRSLLLHISRAYIIALPNILNQYAKNSFCFVRV